MAHTHTTETGRRLCSVCRKASATQRPVWVARRTEDGRKVSALGARVAVSVIGGTRY